MANLLIAVLLLGGVLAWLLIASRRDARRDPAPPDEGGRFHGRRRQLVLLVVAVVTIGALLFGSGIFSSGESGEEAPGWLAAVFAVAGAGALVLGLTGLGWLVTWTSRRRLHALGEGAEPVVLRGRRLRTARVAWLAIFAALVVVFMATLGGLWTGASRVRVGAVPYDEFLGEGWYSLSVAESRFLADSSIRAGLQVPGWYPWLIVVRQAAIYAGVMGLAWFVFSRRPRHWMAFFVSIFIPVLALATIGSGGTPRLDEIWLPLGGLAGVLQAMALIAVGAFLWVFPDGRFRGTYVRYLGMLVLLGLPLGLLGGDDSGLVGGLAWMFIVVMVALIVSGGIATQVFRYRRASAEGRREARWTLATLLLLAAWLTGGTALNSVFDGANWPAFAWRQAHLTLYVATPLLVGFFILWLVRRQGWWDLDLFVNRGVVFAVVAPVLGGLYLGIVLAVGTAFSEWTDQNGTVLAVVAATIAVAVAYRPTSRRVQAAIDRRFFTDRARAVDIVEDFDAELRSDVDQDAVRNRLLATVEQAFEPGVATLLMRPASDGREV